MFHPHKKKQSADAILLYLYLNTRKIWNEFYTPHKNTEDSLHENFCDYYKPMILRYDNRNKIKFEHECNLINYGLSKGATFERVVIILVSTVESFIHEQGDIESRQTKTKFYVACTRAVHSMIFTVDNPKESNYLKKTKLKVGTIIIPAYEYIRRES